MRRDVLERAQAKIRRPIQTMHHLIRKIVVEDEMERGRLHARLRGKDERLFEIDRLAQRRIGNVRVHLSNLVIAIAFTMKLKQDRCRDPRMHDMRFAVELARQDPDERTRLEQVWSSIVIGRDEIQALRQRFLARRISTYGLSTGLVEKEAAVC